MFVEIEQVISEIRGKINFINNLSVSAADYFHAIALVESYQELVILAAERTEQHPEVQRAPELRSILIEHLLRNADRHIDVGTERIFNPIILGSPRSLRDWQEAGYHANRTTSNYPSRLRYWQAIYDEAPRVSAKRIGTTSDIFSGIVYKVSTQPVKRRNKQLDGSYTFSDVHYEEVIADRIANYTATKQLVPWWEIFNYGSTFGGLAGYPNTPGLHFVEDAERTIPTNLTKYLNLMEEFLGTVFTQDSNQYTVSVIEKWLDSRVGQVDKVIPVKDIARIVSLGVPF